MNIFTQSINRRILLLLCSGLILISNKSLSQKSKINPALLYTIKQTLLQNIISDSVRDKDISRLLILPSTKVASSANQESPAPLYDCIIYTANAAALKESGYNIHAAYPKFATASLTADQILSLSERSDIRYIDAPKKTRICNDIAVAATGATLLHAGKLNNTIYKGKNVIVAIFDTGIDWNHPDFKDPNDATKSRILCIWDQTLTANAHEIPAPGFNYGVYYTQAQINAELASPTSSIREKDTNGHGTHVSGSAAGNGDALLSKMYAGMAPEADIVMIKGGDGTFSDVNEINALSFLKHLADSLQRPVVLNMSLGGQYSAHDGSDATDQAIDDFTSSASGRVVVIAAGNENGTNEHNRLTLPANGKSAITFTVDSGGVDNTDYVLDYLLYLNTNSSISAVVTDPLGVNSDTVVTGGYISSQLDTAQAIRVQLQSDVDPNDNNTYLEFYMDRSVAGKKNPRGVWTLTLINNSANAVVVDGWIAGRGSSGAFDGTQLSGGDNNYLVGSPGDASSAITVAAYNSKSSWYADGGGYSFSDPNAFLDSIASFSSHGPRRDGALKPDIAAPGSVLVSCYSSATKPAPAASLLPVPGLYLVDQGTSMACPVTAGGAALLLQANPAATASQIKSLIQSNSMKDAVTEAGTATPNARWGAGRLDVYKAASAIFNPTPAVRKMYKYDASSLDGDVGNYSFPYRAAVRFSPDVSGYLEGVYYGIGTATSKTVVEIRSNNGGIPGALLGRKKIDSANIALYSMNYMDFSDLDIPVTNGTDYFVVLYEDSSKTSDWTLRLETKNPAGRLFGSSDGGNTWGSFSNYNAKIRSTVYSNGLLTDVIATSTSDNTHDVNTNNQFRNSNNELIAQVTPAGASPVSGNITAKVWLEASVPTDNGDKYVSRHYQITPATNSATATAEVTLYFKQEEFDAFNTANADGLLLPSGPGDASGIRNLLIGKYSGVSSDGTGAPSSYSSAETIIDPDDNNVVWNAAANRWEVTFNVTGFSGFVVQTKNAALPIKLNYFTGNSLGKNNIVKWQAATANGIVIFDVQRSASGDPATFTTIHTDNPSAENNLNPFTYTDTLPLQGDNYYRLKMTESPGGILYSDIVDLPQGSTTTLYPNVISKGTVVHVNFAGEEGEIVIVDVAGRKVYARKLIQGLQDLPLPKLPSGIYLYKIQSAGRTGRKVTGKIIVL